MSTFTSSVCPYKGLRPYTEADRDYFFGREQDTEIIASNLYIAPLTILYGTSGAGKSSVLQAGVIPHLMKEPRTVVVYFNQWQSDAFIIALKKLVLDEVCRRASVTPDDAMARVQTALERKQPLDIKTIRLDELLVGSARALRLRLLLIFDQFEEYFLYHSPQTGVEGFDAEFARAVNQEEAGVNFMLSMREEELSKLDRFRQRIPNLLSNLLRLEHLDRKSARRAIINPLRVYNLKSANGAKKSIELGLVKAILEQVNPANLSSDEDGQLQTVSSTRPRAKSGERIETPFLQLVLTRLWEEEQRLGSNKLRLSTLERLEGAKNIARTHLDEVMKRLDEQQLKTAASILRFLVTPSGTKIAQQPSSLAVWAAVDPKQVREVLVALSSKQEMCILRKVSLPNQEDRYELFHDVLGPAIIAWLDRYTKQQQAAEAQLEAERKLKEAQEEAERLLAEERNQRLRERAARLWVGLITAGVLILVMLGLTAFAFVQKAEAGRQAAIAAEESQKARDANEALEKAYKELEEEKRKVEGEKKRAEDNYDKAEEQRKLAEERGEEAEKARVKEAEARALAERATERANLLATTEKTNRLGLGEARAGHTEDAMELFARALEGYARIGDLSGQASAVSNIAETFTTKGNLGSSTLLEYLSQAEDQDKDSDGAAQAAYAEIMLAAQFQELEKSNEKRRLEIEGARKSAVSEYNNALSIMQTMESQNQPEHKNKALVLKRLGDIQILQSLQRMGATADKTDEAKEAARAGLVEGVKYYYLSSQAYSKAGDLTRQAKALRTAGNLLYLINLDRGSELKSSGDSSKRADFKKEADEAIAHFKEASAIYKQLDDKRDEAWMLLKVAKTYDEVLDGYENSKEQAIPYYKQASVLFGEIDRPDLEAEYDEEIAKLYIDLKQKDNAFTYYDLAFKARLKAERIGRARPGTSKETPIWEIRGLYSDSEQGRQKLDSYFQSIVGMFKDPAERAALFNLFSRTYTDVGSGPVPQEREDKGRAIYYLEQERNSWQQANKPYEAARAQFYIAKLHSDSKETAKAVQAFDDFIQLYRAIDPQKLDDYKKPLRIHLDAQLREAGDILIQLNETPKAIEAYKESFDLVMKPESDYNYNLDQIAKTLGKLYIEQKNVQAAEDVFQRLLKNAAPAYRFADIGDLYAESKEHTESAVRYYLEAIGAHQKTYKVEDSAYNKENLIDPALRTLQKIIKLYSEGADKSKAKSFLNNYAETARQAGDSFKEGVAREALAELYVAAKDYPPAIRSYELAVAAYLQIKARTVEIRILRAMSKIYEGTDDQKAKELAEEADRLSKQN